MKLPPGAKYFILAGLAGLVAVLLVRSYIGSRVAAPLKPTGPVVVAEVDLAPGTALAGRMLRVAAWPRDIIPPKAVGSPKELEGRVAQTAIAKGEPILLTKLAPEGTAAGLGGLLAPDKLALTVRTDEVSGVAGFINPGDRIDVLMEIPSPGEGQEHFSKIILQNLKVLSKGQVWDQTKDKDKPQVVNTVTLEVTPQQAEVLNLASFQGKIRLALRNQLNTAAFDTGGVVTSQLGHARRPVAAVDGSKNKAPRQVRTVQVIKRMKVSEKEL
jgi:pilus assembly protein CpaB